METAKLSDLATPAGDTLQACGLPAEKPEFVPPSLQERDVYGLRHTSRPYGDPNLTLHTYKCDRRRVEVGIVIVEQGTPDENENTIIELHLEVRDDECPHIWSVIFEHSVSYILSCCSDGGLEEYLRRQRPDDYSRVLEVIALAFLDRLAHSWH
jgi:hypothetical protein